MPRPTPRPTDMRHRRGIARLCGMRRLAVALALVLGAGALATTRVTLAQAGQTPIYTDDSTAASEGVDRARDQLARGNVDEAVEVLRGLLRTEGDRVILVGDDDSLYYSVRDVINRMLLRHPELSERYLAAESAEARRLLALGNLEEVERIALLTPAGYEAAIRLAQRRMEAAQFDAAWLLLKELEDHPTRRQPDAAAAFAELATRVIRYLPDDERSLAALSRWRDEAGLGAIGDVARIDGPERFDGVTPFEPGPEVDLSGIVSRPLWSEPLSLISDDENEGNSIRPSAINRGRVQNRPWRVFPTVSGDTIYISDGISAAAWDRFTLTPKWRTRCTLDADEELESQALSARSRGIRSNDPEAARTITTVGRWVIAAAAETVAEARNGASMVVAIDSETGQVRWRMPLRVAAPTLDGATIQGRILIDQGVVIVTVSKELSERRLDSVQLLGLELTSGRPLWRRPLGSTGTLPFSTTGSSADLSVVRGGVVYVLDSLGFAAAVETVTGRTAWVRDLRIDRNLVTPSEPWGSMGPVLLGDSVFVITPDYLRIDELDAHSGRQIASRRAIQMLGEDQSPLYPLNAGGDLAIVGTTAVFAIAPEDFPDPERRAFRVLDLGSESFQGRAVIAGRTVIVPTRTGLRSAPIAPGDGAEPALTHLEEPGNVLAMESQLVVIDDAKVRTYLLWDVAQRVLSERMRMTPGDPTPAVTFAELAYRAAKPDRIIPAVEQALQSIERSPLVDRNRAARSRLFRSLLAMVEPDDNDPQLGMLSGEQVERLLVELGRAAAEPTERVEHLMARGRFYEAGGRTDFAVESYQRILDDPTLASASLPVDGVNSRAQSEATKRLRRIVRRNGASVYAAYEVEARRMLGMIQPGAGPEQYTALAQRYPVARAGVEAWLMAATSYLSRGRPHGAVFALESGLLSAEDALSVDDALLGEIAGRLINQLAEIGRVSAASDLLDRLTTQRRTLVFTSGYSPIDLGVLRSDLDRRLSMLDRRPRVGLLGEKPSIQTLDGWSIMTPVLRRIVGGPTDYTVLEREGEIGVWEVDPVTGLRERWAVEADEHTALVDSDERSVFLARKAGESWSYERRDVRSGDKAWGSVPFAEAFGFGQGEQHRTITTPLDGARSAVEQRFAVDDQTLVVADRGGRAVGYDKITGRERWRLPATLDGLVDLSVNAGVVAIVGYRVNEGASGTPIPAMAVYDNRTGQLLHRIDLETGQAHWVRVTDAAEAIVGAAGAVSLYDVFTGRRRWSVGGNAGRHTTDAWVFPGRVVVLNDRGDLRQIETESGQPMPEPMQTQGRVTSSTPISGGAVGDRSAFATTIGIVVFDRRGEPVGLDHRPTNATIHPAEFGADRFVTICMVAGSIDGDVFYYDLQFFSMESCALEQRRAVGLFPTPTRIALLDSRVLVTSGPGTVVLDTE